jgi:hypothetical protein
VAACEERSPATGRPKFQSNRRVSWCLTSFVLPLLLSILEPSQNGSLKQSA